MASSAFLFPGQGAQRVGMGADVLDHSPAAQHVFAVAAEVVGQDLATLCREGPQGALTETRWAQPTIFATSAAYLAAYLEHLEVESVSALPVEQRPVLVTGHSLGELTALYAAGALSLEAACALVWQRASLMHRAAELTPGGMAAVIGAAPQIVAQLCARVRARKPQRILSIANYNTPQQVVVAGDKESLQEVTDLLKADRTIRVIPLRVSGAFHTEAMAVVAEEWRAAVTRAPLTDAEIPLVANTTAQIIARQEDICAELVNQLTSPVRWTAILDLLLRRHLSPLLEFGPGDVLTSMIRRLAPQMTAMAVNSSEAVAQITGAREAA